MKQAQKYENGPGSRMDKPDKIRLLTYWIVRNEPNQAREYKGLDVIS